MASEMVSWGFLAIAVQTIDRFFCFWVSGGIEKSRGEGKARDLGSLL